MLHRDPCGLRKSREEDSSQEKIRAATLKRQFSEGFGKLWRNTGHEMMKGHSENRAPFEHKAWCLGWSGMRCREGRGFWTGSGNNQLTWGPSVRATRTDRRLWIFKVGLNVKQLDSFSRILQKWMARKWEPSIAIWMAGGKSELRGTDFWERWAQSETYDWPETR